MGDLAHLGATLWKERATQIPGTEGRPLTMGPPMVRLNRTDYANSIQVGPGPSSQDALSVLIYSDDPQAKPIDDGGILMDLHAVLDYAPKAYLSKAGNKYLRIPFRHATTEAGGYFGQRFQGSSGALSPRIIGIMQSKQKYLTIGTRFAPSASGSGRFVERNVYTPRPGRLTAEEILGGGAGPMSPSQRNLIGLMRVGKQGHGAYLTIRTLSQANDKGWRIPGYQAQHLTTQVASDLKALSTDWFAESLRADVTAVAERVGGNP
jgi:hypothetical protein